MYGLFEEESFSITPLEYGRSVERLMGVAMSNHGTSEVAARLLLSAFDGYSWKIGVAELCRLDSSLREDCIRVIQGRILNNTSPESVLDDGASRFIDLVKRYSFD